jgi:diaminohydroxyphosphoribosylaminopyrimidine deaminase/5-amino-6-(5-phosphoribosylamino)uracil reductase
MDTDQSWMKKVLDLARKGEGRVSPNPLVGAILVKGGVEVSRGFHSRFGGPHAEVKALSGLSDDLTRDATLYVNLEPCCHHGKTPPCTDLILRSGIQRVVAGMQDPNPLVKGRGIRLLRKNGIRVRSGVLKPECLCLNKPYIKFITKHKPYVSLKIAQTLDGKIATMDRQSKWITDEKSRKEVQRIRYKQDAILVGIETVLEDDPLLTVRTSAPKGIFRIVLDSNLRIPLTARVLSAQERNPTILATNGGGSPKKRKELARMGVRVWDFTGTGDSLVPIDSLLKRLAEEGIGKLLVEGGGKVFTRFVLYREADRLLVFMAPKLFGEGISAFSDLSVRRTEEALLLKNARWRSIGRDLFMEAEF